VTLAILEAGKPPGDLGLRFGDYPGMFEALLGCKAARYDVEAARRSARAAYDRAGGDLSRLPPLALPGEEFERTFAKP